ncbi:hypothetical protein [Saccharothrix syringae]|uniref:Secreted protein n=1 Tax=Saccharothrix syringae TaxID=103733 RepID=A0A5Q0GYB0_SACSY|nr:hypothetical protein [Saccharothrix syringae]QFZ19097.1 hypothetical protein EKG83_18070 [Saccharothrix syringae]
MFPQRNLHHGVHRIARRGGVVVAAAGALLAALLALPAQAGAEVVDGLCTAGGSTQEFSPGLTLEERNITVHQEGRLLGCASTERPAIKSGTFTFNGHGRASCVQGSLAGDFIFTWYDSPVPGEGHVVGTSKVELELAVVLRPVGQNVAVATGKVNAGNTYVGDDMTYTEALVSPEAAKCLTSQGVQSQQGVSAGLVFVGL